MDVSDPIERALKREIPLLAYLVRELDTSRCIKGSFQFVDVSCKSSAGLALRMWADPSRKR
ncbi:hypothetical protein CY34DRAFT_813089 [Suillus luteus UH-Slu-Lm8-n1]|uniref:Uncharacterized protein n=1 Tax=Suillus luteus UH-Slu-Lm8-n1 TaxID=930992 RepID=A0A0D0AIT0_9AGAM|nr:hypothetical protein CY34DRAFT_813089 [Suillus luteus UH-Slu-Lm8-n1]